jgi:hypothetical protein
LRAQALRVDLRGWFLAAGMAMHLGIEALMEVGPFPGGTLVLYAAWIAPGEWTKGSRRDATRARSKRGWLP